MNRAEILDEAKRLVTRERAATHGDAEAQYDRIARRWSMILGKPVTAEQALLAMIEVKIARAAINPGHADNWVDIAGYAALAGEIALKGRA